MVSPPPERHDNTRLRDTQSNAFSAALSVNVSLELSTRTYD